MEPALTSLPPRIFRTCRTTDPLQFPPWDNLRKSIRGRWDDTEEDYRVLYCASTERGAFVEALQDLRPSEEGAACLAEIAGDDEDDFPLPQILQERLRNRWLATLIPSNPNDHVVSVALPASRRYFEKHFSVASLKIGDFIGTDRVLSRRTSRLLYEKGYQGLSAPSAECQDAEAIAIFEEQPISMRLRIALVPERIDLALTRPDVMRETAAYLGFPVYPRALE